MFSRRRFLKAGGAGMITGTGLPAALPSTAYAGGVDPSPSDGAGFRGAGAALATRGPPPAKVLLDNIVGLGAPRTFGPIWHQTTFSSCPASADGRLVYFGRAASYDPAMRNLVVASLDESGNVAGIPQCYPTAHGRLRRSAANTITLYAFNSSTSMGNLRMRLPVAAKMALQRAGMTGGRAGSPRPVGGWSVMTKCTSTGGA